MEFETHAVGVILAGGKSRRMGRDKARLVYCGRSLLDRMVEILNTAGVSEVCIAGEGFPDYHCLPDPQPFAGPAQAIRNVLARLPSGVGALIVPVDMPLLDPLLLRALRSHPDGARFDGWPLPVWIPSSRRISAEKETPKKDSVRALLREMRIREIALPTGGERSMANINTPEDWDELAGKIPAGIAGRSA